MAFLLINTVLYEAQHASATEGERTYIGEAQRAFSGVYRSGVRAGKRQWSFTLIPMSEATYETFVTAMGLDVPLPVSGDFVGGATVTSIIRITSAPFIPSGASFVRVPTISITEV